MTIKKRNIVVSIILILTSIIGLVVFQFILCDSYNIVKFFIIVFGGVFTSSFVTLFISISDYYEEKRNAFECVISSVWNYEKALRELKYLHTYPPIELMINLLAENQDNEHKKLLAKSLQEKDVEELPDSVLEMVKAEHTEEGKLREWLWENAREEEKRIFVEEYQRKEFLDDKIDRLKKTFLNDVSEIVSKYTKYVAYGYSDLERAYGQLDCFKHKQQVELVYEPIVKKHRELILMIKEKGQLILNYSEADGKIIPIIYEILKIQDTIFIKEETQMATGLFNKRVMNTYLFQIEKDVYSVAEKLYGKKLDWRKPQEKDYYTEGWLSTYTTMCSDDKKEGNSEI